MLHQPYIIHPTEIILLLQREDVGSNYVLLISILFFKYIWLYSYKFPQQRTGYHLVNKELAPDGSNDAYWIFFHLPCSSIHE
jgi:hypothetical protein